MFRNAQQTGRTFDMKPRRHPDQVRIIGKAMASKMTKPQKSAKSAPSKSAPAKSNVKPTKAAKPVTSKTSAAKPAAKAPAAKAKAAAKPAAKAAAKPAAKAAPKVAAKPAAKAGAKPAAKAPAKPAAKAAAPAAKAKPAAKLDTVKVSAKAPEKPAAKAPAKGAAKPADKASDKIAAFKAGVAKSAAKAAAKPAKETKTPPKGTAKAAPHVASKVNSSSMKKPEAAKTPVKADAAPVKPAAKIEVKADVKAEVKPEAPKEKKPNPRSIFKSKEYVVYPAHGVGQILDIEEQEVAGHRLELFVINFEKEKMTLRVPTHKWEAVGMRKLADASLVDNAIETLRGRARIKRTMWSRRAQEYEAKINSGDLISIAEVVRDLYRSERQPEQSYSERQLYEAALERMAREVAVVERIEDDAAVKKVEAALQSGSGRSEKIAAPVATTEEPEAA